MKPKRRLNSCMGISNVKYIYGAYGAGNVGDDMLLKAALEYHEQFDTPIKVVAYGKPLLTNHVEWIDHFDFIKNKQKYLNSTTSLHFCGGGLFYASSHCDVMLALARYQKNIGGPVHLEKIGAQGFHCNVKAVKELFQIVNSNSVRDQMSVDILKRHDVCDHAVVDIDYVLTLDKNKITYEKPQEIVIGINHANTQFFYDREHRLKTMEIYTKLAKQFHGKIKFVYFPHVLHYKVKSQNDMYNGRCLQKYSEGLIEYLDFPRDVESALTTFSKFSGAIGWRYHLFVLAKLFNIPGIFVGQPDENKYNAIVNDNNFNFVNFNDDIDCIVDQLEILCKKIQLKTHN